MPFDHQGKSKFSSLMQILALEKAYEYWEKSKFEIISQKVNSPLTSCEGLLSSLSLIDARIRC